MPALRILDQWHLWATTVDVSAQNVGFASTTMPGMSMSPSSTNSTVAAASPEIITVVRYVTPRDIGLALLLAILTFACARNIP